MLRARLEQWKRGEQAALLEVWDADRKRCAGERARDAHQRRPPSVGGRTDVEQLRRECSIGAFGSAMRQLHSHGVADATDPAVVQQLMDP